MMDSGGLCCSPLYESRLSYLSDEKEADMGGLVGIGQFWGGVFGFFGGLGVFFIGGGFLWFVAVYRDVHLSADLAGSQGWSFWIGPGIDTWLSGQAL
jgi:hypothetical protein